MYGHRIGYVRVIRFPRSQTRALLPEVDFSWSGSNLVGGTTREGRSDEYLF